MAQHISNDPTQSVSEAIRTRKSVRQFSAKPVSNELLARIFREASRAPSGGNLQPWRLYILTGDTRDKLIAAVKAKGAPDGPPPYHIYPPKLTQPYRQRRKDVGEWLYKMLGVSRSDRRGKLRQLAKNYEFFGAPVGVIVVVDKQMNQPQWADVGMFMQSIMLLARQHGLHTIAQEAWASYHKVIHDVVGIPDNFMVFCGMGIGYADESAVINSLDTTRVPLDEFVVFSDLESDGKELMSDVDQDDAQEQLIDPSSPHSITPPYSKAKL